jgi:altered-inheritance-of-mitochondria protein 13
MSPDISPERQSTLDNHVRARIQAELEHLRAEEESVQKEIELALERENIDREMSLTGGESPEEVAQGDVKNSTTLLGDLEEIRSKVDRYQSRRQLSDYPAVKESGEAVVLCYK